MDHESEVRDIHQIGHTVQTWASHHHYEQEAQHCMGNVVPVQMIVPELPCLGQEHADNSMSLHNVPQGVNLVGNAINVDEVKDLSDLANAAAGLDRFHHQVTNIIDDSKCIEINTVNENKHDVMVPTYGFEESKLLSNEFSFASFLDMNDVDATFYNEIFQFICSGSFPHGISEVHKKVIRKRSNNYMINENGSFSYGFKNPKKVITSSIEQKQILLGAHISAETRVHLGVRKMYDMILAKYYWRTLYVDVGNVVKSCEACTETNFNTETEFVHTSCTNSEPSSISLPTDRIMKVWKRVEVQIFGPFEKTQNNNEYLITIVDPFSKWMLAKPSLAINIEYNCSSFIFESFCTFGFAQCQVVGLSLQSFEMMQMSYRDKFDHTQGILSTLVPFDVEDVEHSFMFTLQEKSSECIWAGEMVNEMCATNPDTWDEEINRLLFMFSTTKSSEEGTCPFAIMFARGPTAYLSEQDKENIYSGETEKSLEIPVNRRRKLKSSTLQCRHCHVTFTSKISFRIHQRKHTEEAKRRGTLEGESRLIHKFLERRKMISIKTKKRKKLTVPRRLPKASDCIVLVPELVNSVSDNGVSVHDHFIKAVSASYLSNNSSSLKRSVAIDNVSNVRQRVTLSTVEAVKHFMNATKEERSKRGKYFKYTPELRDEIAQYSLDHSIPAASVHWSSKLGSPVSESTIRNFIRIYKCFSTETKEEIGKHAYNHGVERAAVYYSEKLGFEIRKGIVIKFKKMYMKKFYDGGAPGSEFVIPSKKAMTGSSRLKRNFSIQTKDEIGLYASIHSITEAMEHFSAKLEFAVKESTVRKFKRQYLERNEGVSNSEGVSTCAQPPMVPQEAPPAMLSEQTVVHGHHQQQSMDIMHPLSVIGTSNVNSMNNNFVYQHSYPINMAPTGQNTVNSLTFHQGGVINQGVPYQQPVIMNQSFAPHQTFSQGYNFAPSNIGQQQGTPHPLALTHTSSMQLTMGQINQTQGGVHQLIAPYPFEGSTTVSMNEPLSLLKEVDPIPESESLGETLVNVTASVHESGSSISQISIMEQQPSQLQHHSMTQEHPQQQPMTIIQEESPGVQEDPGLTTVEGLSSEEEVNDRIMEDYAAPTKPKKKSKTRKSIRYTYTCGKRGNYVSYSPEIRADIGKYAALNGNLSAITHFKNKLSIDIPESTVRGLRDKYMIKKMRGEKEVKSLGFAQRGRPMRLGKYDEIVQECIRALLKEGEKMSSFLVITTAKQVLTQYEPSILVENGGHVKLNQTWAKSFLKRVGLSHLS